MNKENMMMTVNRIVEEAAFAWVIYAVTFELSRRFLEGLYRQIRPTIRGGVEMTLNSIMRTGRIGRGAQKRGGVPWLQIVLWSVFLLMVVWVSYQAEWQVGTQAIIAGFVAGVLLSVGYVELKHDVYAKSSRSTEANYGEHSIWVTERLAISMLLLALPAALLLLLWIQVDPLFSLTGWAAHWHSVSPDSMAGIAIPIGIMALMVGYHCFDRICKAVLSIAMDDDLGGSDRRYSRKARIGKFVLFLRILLPIGIAVCAVYAQSLEEASIARGLAIGEIAAFLVAVFLYPEGNGVWLVFPSYKFAHQQDSSSSYGRMDRVRKLAIFRGWLLVFMQISVIPASWWMIFVVSMEKFKTIALAAILWGSVISAILLVVLFMVCIPKHRIASRVGWHSYQWADLHYSSYSITMVLLYGLPLVFAVILTKGLTVPGIAGILVVLIGIIVGLGFPSVSEGTNFHPFSSLLVTWLELTMILAILLKFDRPVSGGEYYILTYLILCSAALLSGSWIRRWLGKNDLWYI